MKAVTLWQPYATLVALGVKTIETRSWQTHHRGPIAIHAAKRVVGRRGDVTEVGAYNVTRDAAGLLLRGPDMAWPYRLPLGEFVATANLVDCRPIAGDSDDVPDGMRVDLMYQHPRVATAWVSRDITDELPYGDYKPGRWAWVLADVRPLRKPIAATGRQGLWDWDPEVTS